MARERCNLEKDEAEILKPSSSPSSTSSSPTPSSSTLPPTRLLKPCQDSPNPRTDTSETSVEAYYLSNPNEHTDPVGESKPTIRFINRCSTCRKKVGLTGFRCRCGDLFCGSHRYSDTHDCSFDYKAFGREEITKANPVVRAAKLIKIKDAFVVSLEEKKDVAFKFSLEAY